MNWNPTTAAVLFGATLAASLGGVALFRQWSLRRNLLDVPNDRSSHSIPTPRGGGLVMVAVCLVAYALIAIVFGAPFSPGYFAGAIIVAGISWLDDLFSLPFWSRLIAHICASVLLVADLGVWNEFSIPFVSTIIPVGSVFGGLLTVAWLVWLINAYNFMDGIDGIAALQATIAGLSWCVIGFLFDMPGVFLFAGVLTCAAVGFLVHNWQPARIFMGDVGSAFLGFTLAGLPLLARSESSAYLPWLPVLAVLLVWFFVFDTVFTLIRRALGRKRVWEAHREHIYQKLIIEGRQHSTVTLLYGLGATLLSASLLLALSFSGTFRLLVLFSLLIPTALVIYVGVRKNR